jgi:hypothetical protein
MLLIHSAQTRRVGGHYDVSLIIVRQVTFSAFDGEFACEVRQLTSQKTACIECLRV